jgi:hypothetical protein
MLLAAIDEYHKGTYDFLYLPIDFKVFVVIVEFNELFFFLLNCCLIPKFL